MCRLGLKLWSINENYIEPAKNLFKEGVFQYIELYIVPSSYDKFISIWKNLQENEKIPFIIHAPHFGHDMNLAKKECFEKNMEMYQEVKKFADTLSSEIIIFHPGIDGDIKETVRQLNIIDDKRIVIENKPYYAINSELVCNGNSFEDIKYIMEETSLGFCLDVGHAFCSARAQAKNEILFLKELIKLNPKIFHLSDGQIEQTFDSHLNFGFGNYNFKEIINIIGNNSITIETNKNSNIDLDDFKKDAEYLLKIFALEIQAVPMSGQDIECVYNLANDPIVRKASFNQGNISFSDHQIWFHEKLQDTNSFFYKVINGQDSFIGYVRYDFAESQKEFIVSVAIDKKYRGKGLCSVMLEKTLQEIDNKADVIAFIKHENNASLNCFVKAGYLMEEENYNNHGQACYKLRKKR